MPFRALKQGWDYFFHRVNAPNSDDTARQAVFLQFQQYPSNTVQGRGTLIQQFNGQDVKYWDITQAPQVIQTHGAVPSDATGGGSVAGFIGGQPLTDEMG